MLEIVALKFERLFNRVYEMHITCDDFFWIANQVADLKEKNEEGGLRLMKAFDKAFAEKRLIIHWPS